MNPTKPPETMNAMPSAAEVSRRAKKPRKVPSVARHRGTAVGTFGASLGSVNEARAATTAAAATAKNVRRQPKRSAMKAAAGTPATGATK